MKELYAALREYADDSLLEVVAYNREQLRLRLTLDSHGGKQYVLLIPRPVHVDMPPVVMLGSIEFGSRSLLPPGYSDFRYRGSEGDEDSWRVMKVTDDEENGYFVIFAEREEESTTEDTESTERSRG